MNGPFHQSLHPFLQGIYLFSLFLFCPFFSLFIQVDKLDASESLRKEEEQLTEAQPIVYGKTLVLYLILFYVFVLKYFTYCLKNTFSFLCVCVFGLCLDFVWFGSCFVWCVVVLFNANKYEFYI